MIRNLLALILLFSSVLAHAEDACVFIQKMKIEESQAQTQPSERLSTWKIIQSILFAQDQFKASSTVIHPQYKSDVSILPNRNVILMFGVPSDVESLFLTREKAKSALEHELNINYSKFRELYSMRNLKDCRLMNSLVKLDMDEYKKMIDEHEKYKDVEAYEVDKGISAVVNKFVEERSKSGDNSRLSWEVIHALNIEELKSVFQNPEIENIILITHGSDDGSIYDSYLRLIPSSIFENISAHIRSLSLYNCYSMQSARFYNIEENLKKAPSIWDSRIFYFLGENITGKSAPSFGLKTFLKSVDVSIQKTSRIINQSTSVITNQICSVKIKSDMGKNYGFYLNDYFLGTLINEENILQYQCLNSGKLPRVKIKNLNSLASDANENHTVKIEFLDEKFHLIKETDIKNGNSIYLKLLSFE